ncbi:MAG: TrpR-like protein, YerC/YecD [Clostridia bacterium]|jgi:TrpR-related protein YerC/YecD|nr:TrpR-like protein, YerC/YecD [Clostridia bacterium]
MIDKLRNEQMDILVQGILSLKTPDDCYAFLEDLCTATELKSMEQRFTVARMLLDGKQYSEIVSKTGASTATISRVNRALMYGADGYQKVIKKIKGE